MSFFTDELAEVKTHKKEFLSQMEEGAMARLEKGRRTTAYGLRAGEPPSGCTALRRGLIGVRSIRKVIVGV